MDPSRLVNRSSRIQRAACAASRGDLEREDRQVAAGHRRIESEGSEARPPAESRRRAERHRRGDGRVGVQRQHRVEDHSAQRVPDEVDLRSAGARAHELHAGGQVQLGEGVEVPVVPALAADERRFAGEAGAAQAHGVDVEAGRREEARQAVLLVEVDAALVGDDAVQEQDRPAIRPRRSVVDEGEVPAVGGPGGVPLCGRRQGGRRPRRPQRRASRYRQRG